MIGVLDDLVQHARTQKKVPPQLGLRQRAQSWHAGIEMLVPHLHGQFYGSHRGSAMAPA